VGKIAHKSVDKKAYTTAAHILQGIEVCSQTYGLAGKIDTFDITCGALVERKYKIKKFLRGCAISFMRRWFVCKKWVIK